MVTGGRNSNATPAQSPNVVRHFRETSFNMKQKLLKWTLRITAVTLLTLALLICIVLTPSLMYANKTMVDNFTVYHNKPLDKEGKIKKIVNKIEDLLTFIKIETAKNTE